jgi:hypothetical protein
VDEYIAASGGAQVARDPVTRARIKTATLDAATR